MLEPGYGYVRISQFQERTGEDLAKRARRTCSSRGELKGLVLDLRNDPGGLLNGAVGDLGGVPAARTRWSSTPTAAPRTRACKFYATPRGLPARRGDDMLQGPAGGGEEGADGGAGQRRHGLGLRDRRRRAAGPQARDRDRHADVRQGLGADDPAARQQHRRSSSPRRATTRRAGRSIQAKGIEPDIIVDDRARHRRTASAKPTSSGTSRTARTRPPPRRRDGRSAPRRRRRRSRRRDRPSRRSRIELGVDGRLPAAAGDRTILKGVPVIAPDARRSRQTKQRREAEAEVELTTREAPVVAGPFAFGGSGLRMNDEQLLRYSRHILLDELGIEGAGEAARRARAGRRRGRPRAARRRSSSPRPASARSRLRRRHGRPHQPAAPDPLRDARSSARPKVDAAAAALARDQSRGARSSRSQERVGPDRARRAGRARPTSCSTARDNFATRHAVNRACVRSASRSSPAPRSASTARSRCSTCATPRCALLPLPVPRGRASSRRCAARRWACSRRSSASSARRRRRKR